MNFSSWQLFLHLKSSFLLRSLLSLCVFMLMATGVPAQVQQDTLNGTDTVKSALRDTQRLADTAKPVAPDTIAGPVRTEVSVMPVGLGHPWTPVVGPGLERQALTQHAFFPFDETPVLFRSGLKVFRGKEPLFYAVIGLLLLFALLKLGFAKYFNDLYRVFFRTTLKQRQIKEQLIQTPLPSLMFNIFFVASAGMYANLVLTEFGIRLVENFWISYLYCCMALAVIYLGKYIALKICGWLFNVRQAADAYIFIVFIINKMIGIAVLPFIVLLSFTDGVMHLVSFVVSGCLVAGLFLYRFILGYGSIRNEVRFNLFHFFLFLCAFEIAPVLLIYRLLLFFF